MFLPSDVVRMARPNRRMFLVDVIRPPLPTPDAVLTNEVDTSADSDLPRLVRVLVSAPEEDQPDAQPPKADDDDYLPRPAPADGVVGKAEVQIPVPAKFFLVFLFAWFSCCRFCCCRP